MAQKKTPYQKALEEEEGGTSGTTSNRPKSREKRIGGDHGYGKGIHLIRKAPPNPEKQTYNDEPLQTTGKRKEAAAATVKKPVSRKKNVKGIGTLGPTKSTSGRKF